MFVSTSSNCLLILREFSLNLMKPWTEKTFRTGVFITDLSIVSNSFALFGHLKFWNVAANSSLCLLIFNVWALLKIKYTQDRKKDSVIPIRSKDGSEMEIVFIFKFNQPNQPIIFYNIQFKFIVSFYAYDEIEFMAPFLLLSSVHELQPCVHKDFPLIMNFTANFLNEFLATVRFRNVWMQDDIRSTKNTISASKPSYECVFSIG